MINNSIICADCDEVMSVYELHDFYCADSKLVLQVEERVCLQCSASTWQLINLAAASQSIQIGRSETLEVTLTSERVERKISKIKLNKLMQLYFYEFVRNICFDKKDHIWYRGYALELWENVIGVSNTLDLSKKEITALIAISDGLDMWVIDSQEEGEFKKNTHPFIPLKAWKGLYEKRHKAIKHFENEQSHDTGNSPSDPKS